MRNTCPAAACRWSAATLRLDKVGPFAYAARAPDRVSTTGMAGHPKGLRSMGNQDRSRLTEATPPPAWSERRAVWVVLLAAVCALTLFANLGGKDFWGADESRHAQRVREMLASGQWLKPTFLGQANLDKPPLQHMLMAGAGRLFGPTDAILRLPTAAFGLLAVLLTFALGAHLYGTRAGGIAGFVLATAFLFVFYARTAFVDVPLVACITGAVFAGHRALERERGWGGWAALAVLFLAAGFMAKGLAGLVLPLLVLWAGGSVGSRWWRLAGITAVAVLTAAPLYVALGPEFSGRFLQFDHLRRFFVAQDELGGDQPFYFYVPALLGNWFPWTILLPAVVAALVMTPGALRRWRLPLGWFAVTFLLLSLGTNKREPYLLPLFPALALLYGTAAEEFLSGRAGGRLRPWWRAVALALGGACAVGGALLPLLWPSRLGAIRWEGWSLVLVAGGVGVVLCALRRSDWSIVAATGVLVVAVVELLVWQLFPAMNATRSARATAAAVRAVADPARLGVTPGTHPGVIYYLHLPRPAEALVPPARVAEVLQAGRPVLMSLPPGIPMPEILSSGQVKIRTRMRFQRLEYLVLEWAGESASK